MGALMTIRKSMRGNRPKGVGPVTGVTRNFRTYRLIKATSERMELRPTVLNRLSFLMWTIPMSAFTVVAFAELGRWAGIGTLVVTITTSLLLAALPAARVFDRGRGLLWIGKEPKTDAAKRDSTFPLSLASIRSVQLLVAGYNTFTEGTSTNLCYELNLVLRSRERLNLDIIPSQPQARRDAAELAEFLNVPLKDHSL